MKSEDRIIELLAEYLKKTDQLFDRMDHTDRNIDIMSKAILEHSVKFDKVNDEIKHLREDQGVMLRELLSLSKRVSIVEGKF
jgi:uncharacterized coiled-coil DUF342 family protein